jgi:hypothetical protein
MTDVRNERDEDLYGRGKKRHLHKLKSGSDARDHNSVGNSNNSPKLISTSSSSSTTIARLPRTRWMCIDTCQATPNDENQQLQPCETMITNPTQSRVTNPHRHRVPCSSLAKSSSTNQPVKTPQVHPFPSTCRQVKSERLQYSEQLTGRPAGKVGKKQYRDPLQKTPCYGGCCNKSSILEEDLSTVSRDARPIAVAFILVPVPMYSTRTMNTPVFGEQTTSSWTAEGSWLAPCTHPSAAP